MEWKRNDRLDLAPNPAAHPALADPAIRRALGMAIDLPSLVRALDLGEFVQPAGGPYSGLFGSLGAPGQLPLLAYDTTGARPILESKGWRDSDGDGIRDRNGRALRFRMLTNTGSRRRADAQVIVQRYWREVGVDVELAQMEVGTLYGQLQARDHDAVLLGWQVSTDPDLAQILGRDGAFNFVDYRGTTAQQAIGRARAAPTQAEAERHWMEAAQAVVADQPYTFLFFVDQPFAVGRRLRAVQVNTVSPYADAWRWWIPRMLQGGPAGGDSGAPPR